MSAATAVASHPHLGFDGAQVRSNYNAPHSEEMPWDAYGPSNDGFRSNQTQKGFAGPSRSRFLPPNSETTQWDRFGAVNDGFRGRSPTAWDNPAHRWDNRGGRHVPASENDWGRREGEPNSEMQRCDQRRQDQPPTRPDPRPDPKLPYSDWARERTAWDNPDHKHEIHDGRQSTAWDRPWACHDGGGYSEPPLYDHYRSHRPRYEKTIPLCFDGSEAARSNDSKFDHIDLAENQKVLSVCVEAEAWLREKQQHQDTLPKYTTPVLLSAEVRKKVESLDMSCRPIMMKPKPAAKPSTPEPVPTERGMEVVSDEEDDADKMWEEEQVRKGLGKWPDDGVGIQEENVHVSKNVVEARDEAEPVIENPTIIDEAPKKSYAPIAMHLKVTTATLSRFPASVFVPFLEGKKVFVPFIDMSSTAGIEPHSVNVYGNIEGSRSIIRWAFDPGGVISPKLLFRTLFVVSWFPP